MKKIFSQHEFYISIIIILFSIFFGLINPAFWSLSNIFDLLKSTVVMGMFALGVLIVMVSGGVDISFTAIAAFSMYVTSKLILMAGFSGNIIVAFLLAGLIGLLLGFFNAFFISFFRLPTLIVTLGTASLFRGFLLAFIGTRIISILPQGYIRFSKLVLLEKTMANGESYGLSITILIFLFAAILVWLPLRYTMTGRGIYALGGDPAAAERAGFNIKGLQFIIYGTAGFLSGIAGIIHTCTMRNANPFDLVGTELVVIAAVVLGGASITGGRGTVIGTVLGVLLIVIMNNSLILLGIPSYWQRVVVGLIIIIATAITVRRKFK